MIAAVIPHPRIEMGNYDALLKNLKKLKYSLGRKGAANTQFHSYVSPHPALTGTPLRELGEGRGVRFLNTTWYKCTLCNTRSNKGEI